MRTLDILKKAFVLFTAASAISFVSLTNLRADDSSSFYLYFIELNTRAILEAVNNLPTVLQNSFKGMDNITANDDTSSTVGMQENFARTSQSIISNNDSQNSVQMQLIADFLHQPISVFTKISPRTMRPMIYEIAPYVNDISYSSMLGFPPAKNVPFTPYNYIKYTAGIDTIHVLPGNNWQGKEADQIKYLNYFNTIASIETFDAYVLSNILAEQKTGNGLSQAQNELIKQAGNQDWLAQITAEEIGKVLRQMLMFQSQSYVLLSELLKAEKQILSAQVMTNTLLIQNNQPIENMLVSRAQGVPLQP